MVASNRADDASLDAGGRAAGGGISTDSASARVELRDSVISFNVADSPGGGSGGGLDGEFRLLRTSVVGNQAVGSSASEGGGLITNGSSQLVNSSVLDNHSDGDAGGIAFGTGTSAVTMRLHSSTVVGNHAGGDAGGLRVTAGLLEFGLTVIAGNSAGGARDDCLGSPRSLGGNLIQSIGLCTPTVTSSDQLGAVAGLAPAANNGGPVAGSSLGVVSGLTTRAPLADSALLDLAAAAFCTDAEGSPLASDQTGRARVVDGPDADSLAECDIGAVEYVATLFTDGFEAASP